jgi:hypothetical protein
MFLERRDLLGTNYSSIHKKSDLLELRIRQQAGEGAGGFLASCVFGRSLAASIIVDLIACWAVFDKGLVFLHGSLEGRFDR